MKRITQLVLLVTALAVPRIVLADFEVLTISDPDFVNRDPTVSETGLVVWYGYTQRGLGGTRVRVFGWKDGRLMPVRTGLFGSELAYRAISLRPSVQGDVATWSMSFTDTDRDVTWTMREVPEDRRDDPYPELRAHSRRLDSPVDGLLVAHRRAYIRPERTGEDAAELHPPPEGARRQRALRSELPEEEEPDRPATAREVQENRRAPSGNLEIVSYDFSRHGGLRVLHPPFRRISVNSRNDINPSVGENLIVWQKARGYPFGWEIMAYEHRNDEAAAGPEGEAIELAAPPADGETDSPIPVPRGRRFQLTRNFYYDLKPVTRGNRVAWYGWDGNNFQVYLYDHDSGVTYQVSRNQEQNVAVQMDRHGNLAWRTQAAYRGDIFLWDGQEVRQLSQNGNENINHSLWDGKVAWQGFDGNAYQIFYFDGETVHQITQTNWDNVNPHLNDGVITWASYVDDEDAEIYAWVDGRTIRITDDDIEHGRPKTANGVIVWQAEVPGGTQIMMARPRSDEDEQVAAVAP